jgi:hypothetical protein
MNWLPDIGNLVAWLGVGGLATTAVLAFVLPGLLPTILVKAVLGVVDALVMIASYVGGKLSSGMQWITQSYAAMFTLVFAIIVSGWAGDRYEFVRPYIPAWARSEPAAVSEYKRKEAARARPKQTRTASAPRPKSTLQEIKCALTPGAC